MPLHTSYADQYALPGVTFNFNFIITPLDLAGATAKYVIDGIGTFTVTCSNTFAGVNEYAHFDLAVPGATTIAWVPGTYDYRCIVTFADTTTAVVVAGIHLVKAFEVLS